MSNHGKREFKREHGDEQQIFSKKYVAKAQRGGEIGLNAAAFVRKAVIGGRHQNQDEIGHHAREKTSPRRCPCRPSDAFRQNCDAEEQDQQRGHQQREKGETVARQIAKLLAKDRGHLRRKQTQVDRRRRLSRDRTNGGSRRRCGFTQFFAAILRGKTAPQERAEKTDVEQKGVAKLRRKSAGCS